MKSDRDREQSVAIIVRARGVLLSRLGENTLARIGAMNALELAAKANAFACSDSVDRYRAELIGEAMGHLWKAQEGRYDFNGGER